MKRIIIALALAIATIAQSTAQVEISRVDRVTPNDEIFMDMAVTVAQTAIAQKYKPAGAVVVLNGAWKSSGMAVGGLTCEEDALARTRRTTMPLAVVYTVNEPTTAAVDAMRQAQIETVYYVNPREAVIAAGLASADDYAPSTRTDLPAIKVVRMDYAPASDLIKKK